MLEKLTKKDKEIVMMIREKVPKVTVRSSVCWWQIHLWKYRKYQVPVIGLKMAIEIVLMVKEELGENRGK